MVSAAIIPMRYKISKAKQAADQTCQAYRGILFSIKMLQSWGSQKLPDNMTGYRTRRRDFFFKKQKHNVHRLLTWKLWSVRLYRCQEFLAMISVLFALLAVFTLL